MSDGDWMVGADTVVAPDRVAAFAEAIGHSRPSVPPTFAVTLTWDVQNTIMARTLPPAGLGLHGEQAMAFSRTLDPGEVITPRARLDSVVPRRSGTTVTCRTEILASGEPVVTQLFTVFQVNCALPAFGFPSRLGKSSADSASPAAQSIVTRTVDHDQAHRYAAASGDTYRIHTDPAFARSLGLEDVILHGMCTLAIACDAIVITAAGGDDARLSYLEARFTAPVGLGDELTTQVGHQDGTFRTLAGLGRVVLDRGRFGLQGSGAVRPQR